MRFTSGKVADKADQDAETIARVRAMLRGYYAVTGPGAMVAVTHVLDLLDPRGMWSLDPGQRSDSAKGPPQETDPRADPMTGCLPVTPES